MPTRRILSLWFPRLSAERILRHEPELLDQPFAAVASVANAQHLASVTAVAAMAGLRRNMSLSDARAICPDVITRPVNDVRDAQFIAALQRWAERYSPWVAQENGEALYVDITGCAHLFGGEEALAADMDDRLADMGLTRRIGIADTAGAAWAVARYAGAGASASDRSGDAIDQEARATRSRAAKRSKWVRTPMVTDTRHAPRIIPPGQVRRVLAPFPVASLRLDEKTVSNLTRLGLTTIEDISGLPRAALARRFGLEVARHLDQALGAEPEPISPARAQAVYAARMSFPDPIGLADDIEAAILRILPHLCTRLRNQGRGMRRLRMTCFRADASHQVIEIGLARPSDDAAHILPLLKLKVGDVEPGFGIDVIRLHAVVTEPLTLQQHKGHVEAAAHAKEQMTPGGSAAFDALLSRLATRVGLEAMTRLEPAESHIPEKTAIVMTAAYSTPVPEWAKPRTARPIQMFRPEMVRIIEQGRPPAQFVWRRRDFMVLDAIGPERIAPEWWLDDPAWRSGPRDYWTVTTRTGEQLWLFHALGGETSAGWFVQGDFC